MYTGEHDPMHVPRPAYHLPPNEAWRHPDKWIDTKTGHALYDIKKLELPTDDRGIVLVDKAVAYIKSELFWDDFDWLENPGWFDKHHFHFTEADYGPDKHEGNMIPKRFRELPSLIGLGPRTFHNVLHEFTEKPKIPKLDDMGAYIEAYILAHKIFTGLIHAAKNTSEGFDMFASRERTLQAGNVAPLYTDDRVAQEFLRDFFSRNFLSFHQHVQKAKQIAEDHPLFSEALPLLDGKPHVVAKKVGKFVTRGSVNLVPLLKTA